MTKHYSNINLINKTDKAISNIKFLHRYDSELYNYGDKDVLDIGESHVIAVAEFFTGYNRVGVDYWWIQFESEHKTYTCKANFFCSLMAEDAAQDVIVEVYQYKMYVKPSKSSSSYVGLYQPDVLAEQLEMQLIFSGLVSEPQPASVFKKCNFA